MDKQGARMKTREKSLDVELQVERVWPMHRKMMAFYFVCCPPSSSLLDSFFGPELSSLASIPSFHSSLRAPPSWGTNRHHGCVTNIIWVDYFPLFLSLTAVSAHKRRAPPQETKQTQTNTTKQRKNQITKRQSRFFLLP